MLYLNHKMNSKEEHIMKNIFIILGLLVVGMVFIGCPNPNVGGDDYIIENGNGGNGGENNGGNENGGSEIVLSNETIGQFTFYVKTQGFDSQYNGQSTSVPEHNTNTTVGWNNYTYKLPLSQMNNNKYVYFNITNGKITEYRYSSDNVTITCNITNNNTIHNVVFTITKN